MRHRSAFAIVLALSLGAVLTSAANACPGSAKTAAMPLQMAETGNPPPPPATPAIPGR